MEDLRSGRLRAATDELAGMFAAASGASYTKGEALLRPLHLWRCARYSRTRFLRWLFKAEGVLVEPSSDDWDVLAGMGSGAEEGAEGLTYEDALTACSLVSSQFWADSGAKYGLDDLVCLLCLSHHAEAVGSRKLPGPAPPVTVAGDLMGELLPPLGPAAAQGSPRRMMSQKTRDSSRAASGAVSSSSAGDGPARPLRPRWRKGALDGPPLRITVSQLPCPAAMLDLLPLRDQARLCHTSRGSQTWLAPHVRQWGTECWGGVLRRVFAAALLGDDPAVQKALQRDAKASLGDRLRVCAHASDAVEYLSKRHPLPVPDEKHLMSLALARYSCRHRLNRDQLEALSAAHFRPDGCMHLPYVDRVGAWLEMKLNP